MSLPISDKAEACLKESEKLLLECTEGDHEDNSISLECLKNLKKASNDISRQVSGWVLKTVGIFSSVSISC